MLVCFWTSSSKRKVTIDDLRTYYESANERTVNISRRCGLGWGVRLVPGCLDLMLNLGLRFFIPTSSPNKLSFSKEGGSCSYGFSFFFFYLSSFSHVSAQYTRPVCFRGVWVGIHTSGATHKKTID